MTKENRTENQLQLDGTAKVSGLDVFHKALSPEVIHLDRGQLTYQMNIGKQTLELDSTTTVLFNQIKFHPYLRAERMKINGTSLLPQINHGFRPTNYSVLCPKAYSAIWKV